MKDHLNSRIKHREGFRPFAPSVLEERAGDWFEMAGPSPFMLMTCQVQARPAGARAGHHARRRHRAAADRQQGRPTRSTGASFTRSRRKTGVPVVLNTSFNENEPVVNTPEEGVACFLRNDMDVLALGPFLVEKKRVAVLDLKDHRHWCGRRPRRPLAV